MKRGLRQRKWKGLLPTSGEVLGGLARLCDWKPMHSAQERTWRKFCGGGHIHQETRRAIVMEMVEALVRKFGAGRSTAGAPLSHDEATRGLGALIHVHVIWWDALCARIQAALPMEPTACTTAAALRLTAVEVAIRLGGLFLLQGIRVEPPDVSPGQKDDIERIFLPWVLRQVLKESGITRVALAHSLDVSKEAVDQWLKSGALIRPELLDDIAEVIAEKRGGDPRALAMGLRVTRQMTRVLMPLVDAVGQVELGQLSMTLIRLVEVSRVAMDAHVGSLKQEERAKTLSLVVFAGAESPLAPLLRKAMLEQAPDESWKGTIATPPTDWAEFLSLVSTSEMLFSRSRDFLQRQEFPPLGQHAQCFEDLVRLFREGGPPLLPNLSTLSPRESWRQWIMSGVHCFERLSRQPLCPEVLRELGMLADCCGLMAESCAGKLKPEIEALQWKCLAIFILGCMGEGQGLIEQGRYPEALQWAGRIGRCVRAFPPFPTHAGPQLTPVLDLLRLMVRVQDDVEAGRMPRTSSQDFAFLEEMRRQTEVVMLPPPPA